MHIKHIGEDCPFKKTVGVGDILLSVNDLYVRDYDLERFQYILDWLDLKVSNRAPIFMRFARCNYIQALQEITFYIRNNEQRLGEAEQLESKPSLTQVDPEVQRQRCLQAMSMWGIDADTETYLTGSILERIMLCTQTLRKDGWDAFVFESRKWYRNKYYGIFTAFHPAQIFTRALLKEATRSAVRIFKFAMRVITAKRIAGLSRTSSYKFLNPDAVRHEISHVRSRSQSQGSPPHSMLRKEPQGSPPPPQPRALSSAAISETGSGGSSTPPSSPERKTFCQPLAAAFMGTNRVPAQLLNGESSPPSRGNGHVSGPPMGDVTPTAKEKKTADGGDRRRSQGGSHSPMHSLPHPPTQARHTQIGSLAHSPLSQCPLVSTNSSDSDASTNMEAKVPRGDGRGHENNGEVSRRSSSSSAEVSSPRAPPDLVVSDPSTPTTTMVAKTVRRHSRILTKKPHLGIDTNMDGEGGSSDSGGDEAVTSGGPRNLIGGLGSAQYPDPWLNSPISVRKKRSSPLDLKQTARKAGFEIDDEVKDSIGEGDSAKPLE